MSHHPSPLLVPASFEELTGWGMTSPIQCSQGAGLPGVTAAGAGWGRLPEGTPVTKKVMIMMMTRVFGIY